MKKFITYCFVLISFLATSSVVFAQEFSQPSNEIAKGKVVEVLEEFEQEVPGLSYSSIVQELSVKVLSGNEKGEMVQVFNDYLKTKKGDVIYYISNESEVDQEMTRVMIEKSRTKGVLFVFFLFAAAVLIFAGKTGIRSLASLAGSLGVVMFVLVPGLVSGASPVLLSVIVSTFVLFFAVFFTHGFNRRSIIAFSGTVLAVLITGLLAWFAIDITSLTGISNEEIVYLNFNTGGTLDLKGIMLAGIIIGMLGVLDDIAVTQVAVVRELFAASKTIKPIEVYRGAIRVGKEHVAALVNTLVLAYVGASLPLLLLFSSAGSDLGLVMNQEVVVLEILRALIGSIGLVLAVPITTLLAVRVLQKTRGVELSPEEEGGAHCAHGHSHL